MTTTTPQDGLPPDTAGRRALRSSAPVVTAATLALLGVSATGFAAGAGALTGPWLIRAGLIAAGLVAAMVAVTLLMRLFRPADIEWDDFDFADETVSG